MADTGPPWNLRFPGPQDFVRETNFYIEDLAEDTATALSAAGGLVAVKHVLKTDPFSASSVAVGGSVAVTGMSITHEVADPANRLLITAYFGTAGNTAARGNTGISVTQDGTPIGIGDADGSRVRVGAGGWTSAGTDTRVVRALSVTFVHTPGAGEKTYAVRVHNISTSVHTLTVNRSASDANDQNNTRAASALIIQEVKV